MMIVSVADAGNDRLTDTLSHPGTPFSFFHSVTVIHTIRLPLTDTEFRQRWGHRMGNNGVGVQGDGRENEERRTRRVVTGVVVVMVIGEGKGFRVPP